METYGCWGAEARETLAVETYGCWGAEARETLALETYGCWGAEARETQHWRPMAAGVLRPGKH